MRAVWDEIGKRTFETGVDHGMLYPQKDGKYPKGVPWNGLVSVSENPSGAEDNPLYADNMKYLNIKSAEELGLGIECYTYPDEWDACDGSAEMIPGVKLGQQKRNTFGFSYRTKLGNDTAGEDYGYKIHLVYGCSASPSEKSYQTINDSPEAITMSYDITTTPVVVEGFKPVASITIDSTKIAPDLLTKLEDVLYGTDPTTPEGEDGKDPMLPLPADLVALFGVESD